MPWSRPSDAIIVDSATTGPTPVPLTSTASLLLERNGRVFGGRLFGVNAMSLRQAAQDPEAFSDEPAPRGDWRNSGPSGSDTWYTTQTYMDSDDRFVWLASPGTNCTYETWVPRQRYAESLPYRVLTGYTQIGPNRWQASYTETSGAFYLVYKDASIVELPRRLGQGWLMLLARYAVRAEDVAAAAADTTDAEMHQAALEIVDQGAGYSIGDIVAFYSPEPDFGDGVEGPFQLVSSLGAVTDEALEYATGKVERVAFRCWPGVPAGVFIDDNLFLYYSCRPNTPPGESTPYLDAETDLASCIAAYDGGRGPREGWTYVAKFTPAQVGRWLTGRATPIPEDDEGWARPDALVEGEWHHPIRAFAAIFTQPYATRTFDLMIGERVAFVSGKRGISWVGTEEEVFPWLVDAFPVWFGGELSLFVSVQPEAGLEDSQLEEFGRTGFGIWRLRGLDDSIPLTCYYSGGTGPATVPDIRLGRDFVVEDRRSGASADMLVASVRGTAGKFKYLDPDVLVTPDWWRCFTGDGNLRQISASVEDAWVSAVEAWGFPAPRPSELPHAWL